MEFTKDIQFNTNPTVNKELTITYNGTLSNSQELYIVYGYGESWENTSEINMEKTENGFVGTINLLNYDTLNFCFKNSNNEWDNNSYCNYITGITPMVESVAEPTVNQYQNFDIDGLIEELLFEPINNGISNFEEEDNISETQENIDLSYQLSNLISESESTAVDLVEYSTLDEILTATKIETTENAVPEELLNDISVVDFEDEKIANIASDVSENTYNIQTDEITENTIENNTNQSNNIIEENNAIFEDFLSQLSSITTSKKNEKNYLQENSLIETSNSFIVSSRQLGSFYLLRKRIKLALYKVFIKIPKMLLGIESEER